MSPVAVLGEVSKRYSPWSSWVLEDIDLRIEPGTTTLVQGRNGCGKSTLLRILSGACAPTKGRVDRPGSVALVPERVPESPRMSAEAYLAHQARLRGHTVSTSVVRGLAIVEELGLRPGAQASLRTLSKGNRQKVYLAQALFQPMDLIVLDEPFAGLDAQATTVLARLLREAVEGGAAIVMAAHDADPARDRDLILQGGRLN